MIKIFFLFIGLMTILNSSDYDDWLKEQNTQYTNYKKSMDEEFSNMLKKDWEAFKAMSYPSLYKKPKPIVVPKIKKEIIIPKKELIDSPKVKIKPITKKVIPKIKKIKIPKSDNDFSVVSFDFYSQKIYMKYDKKISFDMTLVNKDSISRFWDNSSKTKYKKLLKQINTKSTELNLNDWAKYQLIYKVGLNIYDDKNLANLFTWFILVKMNYDVKIGYDNDKTYLLSTVAHKLYQVAFFAINFKKYYLLNLKGKTNSIGNIYTYKGDYPRASEKLSFAIKKDLKINKNIEQKELSFKYENNDYKINAEYSNDLIRFYKTFPQSNYSIYFSAKNSSALSDTILAQLAQLINGKSEIQAVNLLLRFVQTSFEYKTDPEQFNYEKVMFPEETIFYPYSDCEDRSIIFSYLVKNLLNLDVIGIKYHDHLATAVAFSSNVRGDGLMYNDKNYTIADPTYINANIGMAMPKYKNQKFEIISF